VKGVNTRRASFLGVLVALALALHVLEAQIPTPLPWVRPGFANLMTLIALLSLGWRPALLLTLVRVVVGSLLVGSFLGPGFVLSLAGGLASTAAMALMAPGAWRIWSPLAVSAAGAVAHGGGQLLALRVLHLLPAVDIPWLVPLVLGPSLVAGLCTGLLGNVVLLRWEGYLRAVG
jgi:heptaprenyl diphosphate synthase